jgi:CheY-like chemotaxis protein
MDTENPSRQRNSSKTILVIDNDPVYLLFLSDRLRAEGYTIITAGYGDEGLRVISQRSPHLVLLDVLLPGKNGIDVLTAIKEGDPKIPVVIVTGLWDEKEGRRAFECGAFDYITKPVVMDYLKLAILSALASDEEKTDPKPVFLAGDNPHTKKSLGDQTMEINYFPYRVGRESRKGEARYKKRYPGSLPNNDLYLDDSPPFHLSREHFQIEYRDRQYFVRDRGSSLGLYVNGRPIGGPYPENVQKLEGGENHVVAGGSRSPFRFKMTI